MSEQTTLLPAAQPARWKPTDRQPVRAPTGNDWTAFTEWVIWLDDAYELNLAACWLLHEGVVHTLSALWDAWLAVYSTATGGKPPGDTARAAWHIQFRRPIITELRDESGPLELCRRENAHVPYRQRAEPTRLADALDRAAGDPAANGVTRNEEEIRRFHEHTDTQGAAAAVAVLYHHPKDLA